MLTLHQRLRYVMPTVKFWNDSDTTLADVGTDPNRVRDSWVHAVTGEDLREAIPASGRRVNACAVRAVSTNTLGGAFDGFLRVGLDEKYRPVINAAALLSAVQLFVADALEILRRMPRLRETVQRGYFAATGTVIERDVDEMSMIDQGEMEGGGQVVLAAVVPTAALGD